MFFFCSTCNSLPPVSFRVRSSLSSASRASLISSTTYLLRKYCFLFPAKRNSGSAPRGCWPLCDFAPVNSPWSRLSSAAFSSCCFRSFLAQSGGSDGECDRQREWWCAEAWEDSPRSSPASLDRPVVRLESFHSTGSRTRALPRHRNILQKRQRPQQRYRKKRSAGSGGCSLIPSCYNLMLDRHDLHRKSFCELSVLFREDLSFDCILPGCSTLLPSCYTWC